MGKLLKIIGILILALLFITAMIFSIVLGNIIPSILFGLSALIMLFGTLPNIILND